MSQILARDVQAQWRQRAEQGAEPRTHKSRWVIDKLHDRLPPEHVMLARYLVSRQAVAEGRAPREYDRVDRAGNSAETILLSRLDAQRELTGFERAIYVQLQRGGAMCFRAIIEGDSLAETLRRCGYAAGSDRSVRQLVQLTMLAASDHDELRHQERERLNRDEQVQCRA